MFKLKNKTIIILSPEKWGKMYISKHHYAIELAKRGNTVYFTTINSNIKAVKIIKSDFDNLFLVSYNTFFPYNLKFHFRALFNFLMKFQIRRILKKIAKPINIVWCFEFNIYSNLELFNADLTIFHPVDPIVFDYQIQPAKSADIIFSVSEKILSNFAHINVPKKMINHGVESQFEALANSSYKIKNNKISVGYFGNLLRPIIDHRFIRTIINEHPKIEFHFWGSLNSESNNIGGNSDVEVISFIDYLQKQKNVVLYGVTEKEKLISDIAQNQIDVFILVYSDIVGQSDRSNAHKLIEYLATGKVIVANLFSTYKGFDDLMVMPKDNNDLMLPSLFTKVINNLAHYNSLKLQQKRIKFALDNTYSKQIERIEEYISEVKK